MLRIPDSDDAIRLLSNAIQRVHQEATGINSGVPAAFSQGEELLQDALQYLAHGDIRNARNLIGRYEHWLRQVNATFGRDDAPF